MDKFPKLPKRGNKELGSLRSEIENTALKDGTSINISIPINGFIEIANGIWRSKKSLSLLTSGKNIEDLSMVFRHIESSIDVLNQLGIQIHDHTGEIIPESGSVSIKIITFQPSKGLTREEIIETVKPSIYYKESRIQKGEVIVGVPE